jgi:hypothetical protein
MNRYIFLDNWVSGLLEDERFESALRTYLLREGYTVLVSSLSLTELYNPGWKTKRDRDRTVRAAELYAEVPTVVVNPRRLWEEEIHNNLSRLDDLPLELAFKDIIGEHRKRVVLMFLRADRSFVQHGRDIRDWASSYKRDKESWLDDVQRIIDDACMAGNLASDENGKLVQLDEHKELFLDFLDLRLAPADRISAIPKTPTSHRRGDTVGLTAVRFGSLIFWYLYVNVDPSNRIKHQPSDIGDIYHLSLLPYCEAFTADKPMQRLLQRIDYPGWPTSCKIMDQGQLRNEIGL